MTAESADSGAAAARGAGGSAEAAACRDVEADALEAELAPLVGGPAVTALAKHDTNPANNPQPPKRYRSWPA